MRLRSVENLGFWQKFWQNVKKVLRIDTRDGKVHTDVRRWDDIKKYNITYKR